MPVHIEQLQSEVSVSEGDLPLSEAQIEHLVRIILDRLRRQQRQNEALEEAGTLRMRSAPQNPVRD
jgi:hypothetical protein